MLACLHPLPVRYRLAIPLAFLHIVFSELYRCPGSTKKKAMRGAKPKRSVTMAETSLTIRDLAQIGRIRADSTDVRAEGGPEYPRLIIPIKLTLTPATPPHRVEPYFVILNVHSSLYIESHPLKIADSLTIFTPLEFDNSETSWVYQVEFPLSAHQINRIEEERRGDMKLRVDFRFLTGLYQSVIIQKDGKPTTQRFLQGFERKRDTPQINLVIPQSHWVGRVLPALGLGKYFILEIPQGTGAIPEAWSYLEKADLAFKNWNSKEVFANCRELGTLLDRHVKMKFGAGDFSYKERWGRAYGKFSDLASVDLHLEDLKKSNTYLPDSVKTNKADAEHLILRAKALIKYAGDLLAE